MTQPRTGVAFFCAHSQPRADLKRAAEKLEKAHPDSESIKYGFTIAIMPV